MVGYVLTHLAGAASESLNVNTVVAHPLPSSALLAWLEQLLRERISPSLALFFDPESQQWKLSCVASDATITLRQIPGLYQLGDSSALPCSNWDVGAEGFKSIEPLLPAPGCDEVHQPLLTATESGIHLNYDIPGLTYWMLARCEEVDLPAELLDNHERFPATASHAFRHGYLERPIVDEWLGILRQVILRLWPRLPLVQPQFQVVVSHDIDQPSAYAFGPRSQFLRNVAGDILKRKALAVARDRILVRATSNRHLHPCDPFNTFDWLMATSEAAGIRSAFYFICGRTSPSLDSQYEPEHPAIRHVMRRIHQRGHEIGLHPSYDTCAHPERIAREGQRLQRICKEEGIEQPQWGGRMHYLRWQFPTTAHGWEQAGFHYDSTLSYADRPGFRCGTCHPYPMFDPLVQRALRLIQRPLIAMECSVIDPSYLSLGYGTASLALFQGLKQRCQAVGGQFTLLWHNSHFNTAEDRELYLQVVG
jgi:hypothetical protein